uniref:Uncharacterized protein n=1 Tax=Cynoglossus semilaevis TaxID=244447 RepID=A0A3P8X5C7_CYNSE
TVPGTVRLFLTLSLDSASAPDTYCGDMNICYILDGVLVVYGVILTVLYCRLMVRRRLNITSLQPSQPFCLKNINNDTYETIRMDKKTVF